MHSSVPFKSKRIIVSFGPCLLPEVPPLRLQGHRLLLQTGLLTGGPSAYYEVSLGGAGGSTPAGAGLVLTVAS